VASRAHDCALTRPPLYRSLSSPRLVVAAWGDEIRRDGNGKARQGTPIGSGYGAARDYTAKNAPLLYASTWFAIACSTPPPYLAELSLTSLVSVAFGTWFSGLLMAWSLLLMTGTP
jgi:hypothetical protein